MSFLVFRRSTVVFCVWALAAVARAEPIEAADAQKILREAQRAPEPGSYRRESVRTTKTEKITTTTLTKRIAGRPTVTRIERVAVSLEHPTEVHQRVTITNAEGRWQLYGNKAVLMPKAPEGLRPLELLNAADATGTKGAPSPAAAKARELAQHVHYSAEKVTQDGRELVRVTRAFDEEGQRQLKQLIDVQVDEMKKQLSFGKRMVINAALAVKGGIGGMMPAREVFVIDPAKSVLISTESYNASGKQISSVRTPPPPQRVDDLPDDLFTLPEGAELMRPKSWVEAMELTEKLEAEEKKRVAAGNR